MKYDRTYGDERRDNNCSDPTSIFSSSKNATRLPQRYTKEWTPGSSGIMNTTVLWLALIVMSDSFRSIWIGQFDESIALT